MLKVTMFRSLDDHETTKEYLIDCDSFAVAEIVALAELKKEGLDRSDYQHRIIKPVKVIVPDEK